MKGGVEDAVHDMDTGQYWAGRNGFAGSGSLGAAER
jgi:hypothetical protein